MDNNPQKSFNVSSTNSTSKTVLSGEDMLTLDSQTKKNAEMVRKSVDEVVHQLNFNTKKILQYAESKGSPVIFINDAQKKLKNLGLDIGFIPPIDGFAALILNFTIGANWQFETDAMLVFDKKLVRFDQTMINFYKWYAYFMDLPGLDMYSQLLLRKVSSGKLKMQNLKLDDMTILKEALERDKEATDFALTIVREMEAAKKMKDSGNTKM